MKYQQPFGITDTNAPYINGDPSIARQGSILPAAAAEFPQREIVNLIKKSDQLPSDDDLTQLTKGVRNQWLNYCEDTGAVNNLSVALDPPLQEYKKGIPLRVLMAHSNTGNCVIRVNNLGPRPVVRSSLSELQPNDLRVGQIALLVDDGTRFQVMNYLGAIAGNITNNYIDIPYAEDTSPTANTLTVNFGTQYGTVPAVAGDVVIIKVKNTNTSAVVINVNSLAGQPLRRNDGLALQGLDLLGAEAIIIEYNTTYWQMLRLVRSQVYFKLPTASLILYVRPGGNDTTGDGSINDDAHAFKTIQRAVDYVKLSFLIAGRTVTIKMGTTGTYVGNVLIQNLPGSIVILGDPANAAAYVLQGVNVAGGISTIGISGSGTEVSLQGITVSHVSANVNHVVECNYAGALHIHQCNFTGAFAYNIIATTAGVVTVSGWIHIHQHAYSVFGLSNNASLTIGLWSTVVQTYGYTYYTAFIYCSGGSYAQITYGYCALPGGFYGRRYIADMNSVILTGGGEYYIPGNVDGIVNTNGVYV
jgi:hypothetical protein